MLGAKSVRTSPSRTARPRSPDVSRRTGGILVGLGCLGFLTNLLPASILHLEAFLDRPSSDLRAHLANYENVDGRPPTSAKPPSS